MLIETVITLTALRRMLPPGMLARRVGKSVQLYLAEFPDRPATPEQLGPRAAARIAGEVWKGFDRERQETWSAYARRHERLLRKPGRVRGPVGHQLFLAAAVRRLGLGLDPAVAAPVLSPPEPIEDLRLEPAGEDLREFRFRVFHRLAPGPDLVVAVKITRATRGPGRAPAFGDACLINGWSPESTRPLPESGEVITFSGARFTVTPGQRFGAVATVVRTADGMAREPLMRDLDRV